MANVETTLIDNSDEVTDAMRAAILRGLEACGMAAETYAKEGCPVDTGRLRNSIAHKVVDNETAAYIGSNVKYARVQEFNTNFKHTVGGAHYLKNAAGNHTDEYKRIIKDSLENA